MFVFGRETHLFEDCGLPTVFFIIGINNHKKQRLGARDNPFAVLSLAYSLSCTVISIKHRLPTSLSLYSSMQLYYGILANKAQLGTVLQLLNSWSILTPFYRVRMKVTSDTSSHSYAAYIVYGASVIR